MPNFIEQEIFSRLLDKLSFIKLDPDRVLDLSLLPSDALQKTYPNANIQRNLPSQMQVIDLVFGNLIPLSEDGLSEMHRALKPNRFLVFSQLGPDSFIELQRVREIKRSPFIDLHDIGDALQQGQFADVVMDAERLTLTYDDFDKLWDETQFWHDDLGLATRHFNDVAAAYPKVDGRYPVTLEITYAHALGSEPKAFAQDGVVRIDPTSIKRNPYANGNL